MLVRMAKVQVIGHRRRLGAVLDALYRLGVLQVIDVRDEASLQLPAMPSDAERDEQAEGLRTLRSRIDALLGLAPGGASGDAEPALEAERLPEVESILGELETRVGERVRRLDGLRAERAGLPRYADSLRRLVGLVPEIVELRTHDSAILVLERRHAHLLELLAGELRACVGDRFHIATTPMDAETVGALLVFPRSASERVDAWLGRERVSRLHVPSRFANMPIPEAISALEERMEVLDARIETAEAELAALLAPRLPMLAAARTFAEASLERLRASEAVGALQRTFVVVGWAPRRELRGLREALAREFDGEVLVDEVPVLREEWGEVPLLLSNPAPARPFEFLVGMVGLPRYGTLDPTILMAVFLPLFFGMMLGDIAYGLVLAALALAVRRRFGGRSRVWRDIADILLLGSAWAVVWGVVFGEFLGGVGRSLGLHPLWINREEALESLLLFTVAVGAVHVLLGLLLGMWSSWRRGSRSALLEKVGMLGALSALFLVAGVVAGRLPRQVLTPATAGGVVGLAVVIRSGGPMGWVTGPLELLGSIGNVLSYLRIGAIGLASAYLARVANELAGVAAPLWMGLLVAVLLHALNLALGAFSPSIQALRLHYVEFFGKFHEPGGRAFAPFGARTVPG